MRKVKIVIEEPDDYKFLENVDDDSEVNCPVVSVPDNVVRCNAGCAWFYSYKDWYIYTGEDSVQKYEHRCYCGEKLIGELVE